MDKKEDMPLSEMLELTPEERAELADPKTQKTAIRVSSLVGAGVSFLVASPGLFAAPKFVREFKAVPNSEAFGARLKTVAKNNKAGAFLVALPALAGGFGGILSYFSAKSMMKEELAKIQDMSSKQQEDPSEKSLQPEINYRNDWSEMPRNQKGYRSNVKEIS